MFLTINMRNRRTTPANTKNREKITITTSVCPQVLHGLQPRYRPSEPFPPKNNKKRETNPSPSLTHSLSTYLPLTPTRVSPKQNTHENQRYRREKAARRRQAPARQHTTLTL